MKKLLVRVVRQSPALIVAMLALFVALTGTAVATTSALIGSAQIRNNSITGLDVKNRSLRPIDFRGSVRGPRGLRGLPGATGATGATGAKGDKGDKGDTGAPGTNAATSIVARRVDVPGVAAGTVGVATVTCAAGEKATGGGGLLIGATTQPSMVRSYPSNPNSEVIIADGATPTAWTTRVYNTSGGAGTLHAYAICVSP